MNRSGQNEKSREIFRVFRMNDNEREMPPNTRCSRPGCARGKRGPGNRAIQPDCLENVFAVLHIC